jgi:hypothetical protein
LELQAAYCRWGGANNLRAGIGATTIRQGEDYKIGKHNLLHMSDKD